MQPTITVDDSEVSTAMKRITQTMAPHSLEAFLTGTVEPYFKERAASRFKQQGDNRSGRWKPLAKMTKEIRAEEGFGASRPINIRTGELHDYITKAPGTHGAGAGQAYLVLPGRGSNEEEEKARVAQLGKPQNRPFRPVPARPVMVMNEVDNRQIVRKMNRWFVSSMEIGLGGSWSDIPMGREGTGF